ncbi:ComEC/Rec2 family competence protein [Lutibaculum baratangense]|uniref:ComEC/Rec2 family competence protein n=1 Tax=Lutibaculum baratangense TaxID=1358440 RepID=UPI001269720A|nr:ComEC/Rec2 family competence protein [Lutibaculum baratangense]
MRRLADEPWPAGPGAAPDAAPPAGLVAALERRLEAEGERRFLFAPALIGCGILVFFALRHDPAPEAVALGALASGLLALKLVPGSLARHAAAMLCLVLLGMLAATVRTGLVDAPVFAGEPRVREVSGLVERIERDPASGDRVTLAVRSIAGVAPDAAPRRVTFRSRVREASYEIGDTVAVRAVLMPPPDAARPGGFDFARQAFFAGIGARGYAVSAPVAVDAPPSGLLTRLAIGVERVREAIGGRIRAAMSPEAGAIATALVTGQRSGIGEETQDALRAAGLAHILAISGLHMMLVVGAIFSAVRYGAALVPEIALTRPVKKWAAAAALVGGTAYLLISGMSVATQRAYIMALVVLLAVLADRPAITMRNVALAALAILLLRPEAVVSAGFQMSFAATIALVAAYEALRRRPGREARGERPRRRGGTVGRYVLGLLLTSFVAGAATGPFAAYHFHRVATYGLLGNLLAMPIFGMVVMPAGLAGVLLMPLGLEGPFLWVMGQGIEAILKISRWVAGLEGATGIVPAVGPQSLAAVAFGALWLALWRTGWRWLGAGAIAIGVAMAALAEAPDAYVDRSGRLVALREAHGVTTVGGRGAAYEREQWLLSWGMRTDHPVRSAPCDDLACHDKDGAIRTSRVAHSAAFAEDCALADLVLAAPAAPAWCGERALVLDGETLEKAGAVAIYRAAGEPLALRIETASGRTGARPWNWRWRAHGPPGVPARWERRPRGRAPEEAAHPSAAVGALGGN